MFILWGSGKKKKKTKYKVSDLCGCCGFSAEMFIVKIYNYIHIFYIPFIFWGTKYYVECPKCGAAREMSKEEYKNIKLAYKQNKTMQVQNKVENNQPRNNNVETNKQTTNLQNETLSVMEKLIWQDIDKVMLSIVSKDIVSDSEKFNKFFSSLKSSLIKKYGDGQKVTNTLNKYFNM